MKLKVITYSVFISLASLLSCKSDEIKRPDPVLKTQQKADPATNPVREKRAASNKDALNPVEINKLRSQALAILNHRMKEFPETIAIVEADVWEYQFVYSGEMSQPGEYKGVWLDFKNDHTYEYGKDTEVHGSGKYNFHLERGEILMVDNDPTKKPEEWRVKHADDVMIMMGTATYKDNHTQQKMERRPDSLRS